MRLGGALKFLAKDSALYGIAGSLQKLVALMIIPLISRYLTKEEFGILNTITPFAMVFAGVITLGQDSAIARWFYDSSDNLSKKDHRINVATTGFLIQLTGGILFGFLVYFFGDSISNLLFNNQTQYSILWQIALVSAPASAFMMFSTNIFKWTFQRNRYLFLTISNSLSNAGLIGFFVYFDWGLKGIVLAPTIASSFFSIVGLMLTRKYINLRLIGNLVHWKTMMKFGIPFGLVLVAGTLLPNMDRLFLVRYVEESVIGEYTFAIKIASLFVLVNRAFQIAFGPYSYSIWKEDFAPKLYAQISLVYFSGLIFASMLIAFFVDYLVLIIGSEKYLNAVIFIPWLLFANVLDGMKFFLNIGIDYSKKSYYHIVLLAVAVTFSFTVNWFTIESIGVWGAVLALNLAYLSRNIVAYNISKRFYPINFQLGKFMLLSIFAIAHYVVCIWYYNDGTSLAFSIKTFALIVFPIVIYHTVLTQSQREKSLQILMSFNSKFLRR